MGTLPFRAGYAWLLADCEKQQAVVEGQPS
jgi:hypothetical protein